MTKARRWSLVAVGALAGLAAGDARAQIGPIERFTATSAFDSSDFKQVSVQCPPGTIAFSGGASLTGNQALPVIVHQSQPQGDPPSSWLAVAQEQSATASSWGVTATALCATVTGYELVTASTAFDSTNPKSIDADCPPGKVPIGGGGAVFFFTPDLALNNLGPTATGWEAGAYESDPVSASWILDVKVSCAPPLRLEEFVVRTRNFSEDRDDLLLSCPDGWIALAGGSRATGNSQAALYLTRPGLGLGWEVGGRRISGSSDWSVFGSVLCLAPTLFADGFEEGDTGGWSGTVR